MGRPASSAASTDSSREGSRSGLAICAATSWSSDADVDRVSRAAKSALLPVQA